MRTARRLFGTVLFCSIILFTASFAHAFGFDWENLQSDIAGVGELTDPNAVNTWE
jgi:hypothetical protein